MPVPGAEQPWRLLVFAVCPKCSRRVLCALNAPPLAAYVLSAPFTRKRARRVPAQRGAPPPRPHPPKATRTPSGSPRTRRQMHACSHLQVCSEHLPPHAHRPWLVLHNLLPVLVRLHRHTLLAEAEVGAVVALGKAAVKAGRFDVALAVVDGLRHGGLACGGAGRAWQRDAGLPRGAGRLELLGTTPVPLEGQSAGEAWEWKKEKV
eukprot:364524-Chlamydomonas_euryale.AAC.11